MKQSNYFYDAFFAFVQKKKKVFIVCDRVSR